MVAAASSVLLPSLSSPTSLPLASSNSLFFGHGSSVQFMRKNPSFSLNRRSHGNAGLNCRCLFGLGVPELVVIAGVAAIVFGPKKLPEVGRSIGKTVRSFQQAAKEFETELKKDKETIEEPPPPTDTSKASSVDEKQNLNA
ncbi:sec-independent protein translocase protein TATA, chloroplastic [Amborella trichopoda]|uniref:Sec-independent protein translocase protein TATA, chloroplastic n=1 Tax=Amborella trichopoda TaxID=13333 RepID=W1P0I9_AMBTC|nr:sec-independent protein translocase protein TATA, chloroplastic [Amborella trichopoda]ERN01453.1 hypothetical protein AMTR_s00002p00267770 [Amborella trichopoda]|eukprot:XP_006838884.1 sec-independent protein translocase protein TATA, chloroplastic [Amborella trichopoda]